MDISFEGKRVLVTGAGQGIGKALVARLVKCRATVIALSKTQKNLDDLSKVNPGIKTICVDVREWEATRKAVESILPIHHLINNAGVAKLAPFLQATQQEFDSTFDINVKAIFNISQIVSKDWIKREIMGTIVNMSSQAAKIALNDHAAYCASKAAVDALTRNMALELGPFKIRVNSVNPTVVLTEMGKLGWSDREKAKSMLNKIPLGRFAEVDEVVDATLYLLSNRSSMITGAYLPVDGGYLAV